MNIKDIKATPTCEGRQYKDYEVYMADVVEEKSIKEWIERRKDINLKSQLLHEGAYIRVRFNEDGIIYEMMIHQVAGNLCCMLYRNHDEWSEMIKMIYHFHNKNKIL